MFMCLQKKWRKDYMQNKFIRIKYDDATLSQIAVENIIGIVIVYFEQENKHALQVITKYESFQVFYGTWAKCHELLNKLNNILEAEIVDLN